MDPRLLALAWRVDLAPRPLVASAASSATSWCDPYYEARDGVVVIVEGHWARPGRVFVPPPPAIRVRVIPARPGYVVVPPPRGIHGRILPPPAGGRIGVVVPAPSPIPRVVSAPPPGRAAIVPPSPYRPGGGPDGR